MNNQRAVRRGRQLLLFVRDGQINGTEIETFTFEKRTKMYAFSGEGETVSKEFDELQKEISRQL